MGVDAQILVRIKGRENWLPAEKEMEESYLLASTIGAGHFFIHRDLDTGKLKDHHALSIVQPENNKWGEADPKLIGKVVWYQDGPDIIAEDDEQFLRVHLWSRYYGPSYPRGDWATLRTIIWYLKKRFPTGEVWYGGDSSGICAEHMTDEATAAIDDFFINNAHRPYAAVFKRIQDDEDMPCPTCNFAMDQNGWGRNYKGYYCPGCDSNVSIRDGITKFVAGAA